MPRSFARGGGVTDLHFDRPLWLQTRCTGHVLWALNIEHVDQLAADIGASPRSDRPSSHMFTVLPTWMKHAANRTDILIALGRLRLLADRSSPADRSDAAY
ncbi:hypothetical protein GFY24_09900 [Nocardia sp. SYP-A9097]|uniref:hypothetical protein n=1 Tax=Nocardia sp. SYP-A9097 TaxID=2663237 RepID=UPI001323B368|nr:hypothetical protein [Nocardia sp. SYP-A9097]MRH87762.1 hypothetical protein [Nocardia sp. SYP-A9097]